MNLIKIVAICLLFSCFTILPNPETAQDQEYILLPKKPTVNLISRSTAIRILITAIGITGGVLAYKSLKELDKKPNAKLNIAIGGSTTLASGAFLFYLTDEKLR